MIEKERDKEDSRESTETNPVLKGKRVSWQGMRKEAIDWSDSEASGKLCHYYIILWETSSLSVNLCVSDHRFATWFSDLNRTPESTKPGKQVS